VRGEVGRCGFVNNLGDARARLAIDRARPSARYGFITNPRAPYGATIRRCSRSPFQDQRLARRRGSPPAPSVYARPRAEAPHDRARHHRETNGAELTDGCSVTLIKT